MRSTAVGRIYLDLQRLARRWEVPTGELLTRYVLERFLYRLSQSDHRERLVLKGGMLLEVFDVRRPTRDIDLQGQRLRGDIVAITDVVRRIAATDADDGVAYLCEHLTAEAIREDAVYRGVRLRMPAALGRARTTLRLDISVGEVITPRPQVIHYPTLLGGEAFELVGYAIEAVLAEKVETMFRRGSANTRERDFADVWLVLRRRALDGDRVLAALKATAAQRGTTLTRLAEAVGGLGAQRQGAWSAYVRRSRIPDLPERFGTVLDGIASFVDPLTERSAVGGVWLPEEWRWVSR